MNKSKIFSALALVMALCCILCACDKTDDPTVKKKSKYKTVSEEESSAPAPQFVVNPLTGVEDLSPDKANARPLAIMVNNITVAQKVQTGLGSADIVYETYAEGGITRLLAVYKDVSRAGKIGTVRSARISYVELAEGHDAVYAHAGWDPAFAAPYIKRNNINHIDLNSGKTANYASRAKNGLSSEHTLYTEGSKLSQAINDLGYNKAVTITENWQNFSATPVTPAGGAANTVNVPMSSSNPTKFIYDTATGKYTRNIKSGVQKDYVTGETVQFKNILVLFTNVSMLDAKHVKEDLSSGTGFYASNGGYVPVNWSKGSAKSPLKVTNTDGSPLQYNQGNSWVFFANNTIRSQVTFS